MNNNTDLETQEAVATYWNSKQLLPFDIERKYIQL